MMVLYILLGIVLLYFFIAFICFIVWSINFIIFQGGTHNAFIAALLFGLIWPVILYWLWEDWSIRHD